MQRRDFLKLGTAGVVAGATATLGGTGSAEAACLPAVPAAVTFRLAIRDVAVEMVDGEILNMIGYADVAASIPSRLPTGGAPTTQTMVPGPVIRVKEGTDVTIFVTNNRPESHNFQITGIPGAAIADIPPGATRFRTFRAPVGGSYLYHDTIAGALYRVLGLHGAFIVEPADGGVTTTGSRTPYSLCRFGASTTASVSAVFDAMGTTTRFAGNKWIPSPINQAYSAQEKIWLLSQVDSTINKMLRPGQPFPVSSVGDLVQRWRPDYFTMNGRSGFYLSHDASDVVAFNYIGEPTLIRCMNAGLCTHSTHIHGNHVFEVASDADNGAVQLETNIYERDVWPMKPLARCDLLLPYEVPPDIPTFPMAQEPFPLRYVMHCHTEMSQTAAGGNYPQGLVTHWDIRGPRQTV